MAIIGKTKLFKTLEREFQGYDSMSEEDMECFGYDPFDPDEEDLYEDTIQTLQREMEMNMN